MRALLLATLAALLVSCTSSNDDDSGSASTGGGGCSSHADCPGGHACKLRQCTSSCTSSQPLVGGCVVGAACDNGACVLNTACSETVDCAYDKGRVCQFSTGQCVQAAESCTQGEQETVCANGHTCHVKVCYLDCAGAKGCPSGQSCNAHSCN